MGALVGVACTPNRFAMPSLMAHLGTIEPSFNALIAGALIGLTLVAIALGMAPTAWRLRSRSVAVGLSQEGR